LSPLALGAVNQSPNLLLGMQGVKGGSRPASQSLEVMPGWK
jgi:hypothetical protein